MKYDLLTIILFSWGTLLYGQETIRMVSLDDQPIIVSRLNGKKAYFLVDSGSDISLLNLEHEKKYRFGCQFMKLVEHELHGLNSKHRNKVTIAKEVDLQLGEAQVKGRFLVLDISALASSMEKSTGIEISGIIGSDIMKSYAFLIDYSQREIRFTGR